MAGRVLVCSSALALQNPVRKLPQLVMTRLVDTGARYAQLEAAFAELHAWLSLSPLQWLLVSIHSWPALTAVATFTCRHLQWRQLL